MFSNDAACAYNRASGQCLEDWKHADLQLANEFHKYRHQYPCSTHHHC